MGPRFSFLRFLFAKNEPGLPLGLESQEGDSMQKRDWPSLVERRMRIGLWRLRKMMEYLLNCSREGRGECLCVCLFNCSVDSIKLKEKVQYRTGERVQHPHTSK